MKGDAEKEPEVRVVDRRWWARGETTSDDAAGSALKPTYVEDLERRLADASAQLQAALTDQRRGLDEFEQVKARLRRDTAREVERGKRAVIVDLLEVLDNLDRAITAGRDAGTQETSADSLARGVELVRDQFLARLGALGVQRVPALGEPFDAARHEAVTTTRVEHPTDDGRIVAVIKEGYAIGDDVLRPASVVVGRTGD